jgi:hypothetical protein
VIQTRYSGGAANASAALSLGGAMSSAEVAGEAVTLIDAISGVTLLRGFGNVADPNAAAADQYGAVASLLYRSEDDTMTFKGYGPALDLGGYSYEVVWVPVAVNGNYNLPFTYGGYKASVDVAVVYANLPPSSSATPSRIGVTRTNGGVFPDVTKDIARVGAVDHRCVYIHNGFGSSKTFKVYIGQQPTGSDFIDVGLDPAGPGGGAAVIASSALAPAGVVFSRPISDLTGLEVALTAGQSQALWLRRTVPAMSVVGGDPDSFSIYYEGP